MTSEQRAEHLKDLARSRCERKHPDLYDSMICVGPGSKGFGPPCDDCLAEMEREYEMKRAKAHGRKLSPEEEQKIKEEIGL